MALLKDLQAVGRECEWVEFKMNNSDPAEIGKTISALSNGACYVGEKNGYLVYGVEDKSLHLLGTDFRPRDVKIGNQELENWLATQLSPRINFSLFDFDYDGRHFVIIRITATTNTPVLFKGTGYIRVGGVSKPLKEHPERERKIWTTGAIPFERRDARTDLTDDEVLGLIDYPGYFELSHQPLPPNKISIIEKLTEAKIIHKYEGSYSISNLGAILFAKNLREFESLSRKAVRVIIYAGDNRVKTVKEQVGKYGYATGFEGLIKYIMDQLLTAEVIENALRKQVSMYPALAIRELVANAIIHQDLNMEGTSPMVEIFPNRVEITNPGNPLIDTLRFMDHSPQSRNEAMARFMRDLYICEERGSGIDKVIFECEFQQLPAPDFISAETYTRVILYGQRSLRQMDKQDKIRACYQHACLKYVSGDIMTNQSLRERLGVEDHNYSLVSRIIADTKEAGLILDYAPENRSRAHAKYVPFWA